MRERTSNLLRLLLLPLLSVYLRYIMYYLALHRRRCSTKEAEAFATETLRRIITLDCWFEWLFSLCLFFFNLKDLNATFSFGLYVSHEKCLKYKSLRLAWYERLIHFLQLRCLFRGLCNERPAQCQHSVTFFCIIRLASRSTGN